MFNSQKIFIVIIVLNSHQEKHFEVTVSHLKLM